MKHMIHRYLTWYQYCMILISVAQCTYILYIFVWCLQSLIFGLVLLLQWCRSHFRLHCESYINNKHVCTVLHTGRNTAAISFKCDIEMFRCSQEVQRFHLLIYFLFQVVVMVKCNNAATAAKDALQKVAFAV